MKRYWCLHVWQNSPWNSASSSRSICPASTLLAVSCSNPITLGWVSISICSLIAKPPPPTNNSQRLSPSHGLRLHLLERWKDRPVYVGLSVRSMSVRLWGLVFSFSMGNRAIWHHTSHRSLTVYKQLQTSTLDRATRYSTENVLSRQLNHLWFPPASRLASHPTTRPYSGLMFCSEWPL